MKLYSFLDGHDKIIVEVRAENHEQAVAIAQTTSPEVNRDIPFYSETIEENA